MIIGIQRYAWYEVVWRGMVWYGVVCCLVSGLYSPFIVRFNYHHVIIASTGQTSIRNLPQKSVSLNHHRDGEQALFHTFTVDRLGPKKRDGFP